MQQVFRGKAPTYHLKLENPMALDLTSILMEAAMSELGIVVVTNNPTGLRAQLYTAAKANPAFPKMSFVIPPVDSEGSLWIIKRGATDGPEEN